MHKKTLKKPRNRRRRQFRHFNELLLVTGVVMKYRSYVSRTFVNRGLPAQKIQIIFLEEMIQKLK